MDISRTTPSPDSSKENFPVNTNPHVTKSKPFDKPHIDSSSLSVSVPQNKHDLKINSKVTIKTPEKNPTYDKHIAQLNPNLSPGKIGEMRKEEFQRIAQEANPQKTHIDPPRSPVSQKVNIEEIKNRVLEWNEILKPQRDRLDELGPYILEKMPYYRLDESGKQEEVPFFWQEQGNFFMRFDQFDNLMNLLKDPEDKQTKHLLKDENFLQSLQVESQEPCRKLNEDLTNFIQFVEAHKKYVR